MPTLRTIYWDANVFIAWMTGEERDDPAETEGMLETVEKVERGEVRLVTGEVIRREVLDEAMSREASERYNSLFSRRKSQLLPEDPRVRELVREIRTYYKLKKNSDPSVSVPSLGDAHHLAYAIHYQVDEFQTFDKALLKLDGDVAGYPLKIRRPTVTQRLLFRPPST